MRTKRFWTTAVLSAALCLFAAAVHAEQPVLKTLTAHVVGVAEDGASVAVDFYHPATKAVHRLVFYKDDQTGLSGIDSLKDLRAGQVISIDYVIGPSGRRAIRYLKKVKLSGPPDGLEKFHGI